MAHFGILSISVTAILGHFGNPRVWGINFKTKIPLKWTILALGTINRSQTIAEIIKWPQKNGVF